MSKLTGHVYEKKLILKYLVAQNKCPVTGAPLSEDDLVSLQCELLIVLSHIYFSNPNFSNIVIYLVNKAIKPRPISATSIPGLLATFQVIY